ncbi:MAG: hypothetical protein DWQ44_07660 [Bacteroidetes bacterium]|nr:MAG: hypothetical protein DWQ33_12025 [Bacteroidota bacterium]REJ99889.1 MAG: hypothetical protein DWQ39_13280 [Bacteroidota bacterium]REK34262.1 MAG: hypothetical protein DWQ44_07660 [Bacteroidota bacterium]REK50592.1 MAG: hypothetical protein DWQ48_04570 [Bacteroidota bacterium]
MKLTPEELEILADTRFFDLKKSATEKIMKAFGELEYQLKKHLIPNYQTNLIELDGRSGKIFRGENYKNLPYIVLDYPRLFGKTGVFAFRSMFWWGNGFSFTLHLQGESLSGRIDSINKNLALLAGKNVYVCMNDTPWEYDYGEENYLALDYLLDAGRARFEPETEFIKLSRRCTEMEQIALIDYGKETLKMFLELFCDQEPM